MRRNSLKNIRKFDPIPNFIPFCAVLLFEIYGLAITFGGPFFEVGYFLLVVISQTFAGAYIWAQMRQSDKTLPLPELLAMGFAIGSASAAIAQLIIRDLFGIRIFLSPLVPIIGVAIRLLTKRHPKTPVIITHATTNTLLWLLFPAPLAMSFFIWELQVIFILPLFIFVLLYNRSKRTNYYSLTLIIFSLVAIFSLVVETTFKESIARTLSGWDEIFDEALSIGFSNWGINEHIGRVGNSIAYYKLSHLWLGPTLELIGASPMVISVSVVPLIVFTFLGLSLWTLSHQIYMSSFSAGIASVLVFVQHSLPEPENFSIRIAQCLVLIYSLAALKALVNSWPNRYQKSIVAPTVFFVVFSTRAQFGLILLFGYSIYELNLFLHKKTLLKDYVLTMAAIASSLAICFLIFFNEPAHAMGSPNQGSAINLIYLFISLVVLRSLLPLLVLRQKLNEQTYLLVAIICSAIIVFFLISQSNLANGPSLIIALLASVMISYEVSMLREHLSKLWLSLIGTLFFILGILLRFLYDWYKWTDKSSMTPYLRFFATLVTSEKYLGIISITLFISLFFLLFISISFLGQSLSLGAIFLLSTLSMSFGISLATSYRSITGHLRYQIELAGEITTDSPMSWYEDSDRLAALEWLRSNTLRDDIFAQNTSTPDFSSTAYAGSLIISSSVHRRAYIESVNSTEVQSDYPRHVSHQTERQRKELLRLNTSFRFPIAPSNFDLKNLRKENVKWFVVDLTNTTLRDWEPWATTRFMNEKVAILELAQAPVPSN